MRAHDFGCPSCGAPAGYYCNNAAGKALKTPHKARGARNNPNPNDVERALAGDKNLANANLARTDLRGTDLTNADLPGANLTRASLMDVKLNGANLSGANLEGAKLNGADLEGADLNNARSKGANLNNADLTGAKLYRADLTGADLTGAYLSDADLSVAYLNNANLTGAYLNNANLSGAYLSDADLSGANLTSADLNNAYLKGAKLKGANLYRANLYRANLTVANLSSADLTFAYLSGAYLSGANLTGVNLNYATLTGANLYRAELYGANLLGADLTYADLTYANLTGAKLPGANLKYANLTDANLSDANLSGANLEGADLTGVKLPEIRAGHGRFTTALLKARKASSPKAAKQFKAQFPREFEVLQPIVRGASFSDTTLAEVASETRTPFDWVVVSSEYVQSAQRFSARPNMVYLLCVDLRKFASEDRTLLTQLAEISRRSGHPSARLPLFTIGWVRYAVNNNVWTIEEVQSDVHVVRAQLKSKDSSSVRSQLARAGIDVEDYNRVIDLLRPYTERFYEDAISLILMDAEAAGGEVEMLDYATKRRFGSPRGVYSDLPKRMGMKLGRQSVGIPEVEEPVWYVRPNRTTRRN